MKMLNLKIKTCLFYVLRTAMIKDGKVENFAAIIVQRSHPDLKSILETFDETIAYFKSKP